MSAGIEEEPLISRNQEFNVLYNTFFNNRIVLKFTNCKEREIKISIFNTLGDRIYGKTTSFGPSLILDDEEIRNLKSGIYFVKIESENHRQEVLKIIKQ